jgi:L-lactate dehydrogenase complex protein LldG
VEDTNILYERFKTKIEAVSGECHRVRTFKEGEELITQLLENKGVQSVAMVDSPLTLSLNLTEQLPNHGVTVFKERYQEVTPTVGAGITEVKWAIAELGTLVQYAVDVNERLCSAFTPIHIALVQTSALLPNIMKALSVIHSEPEIPGFVGFITGPSRTSDIERVLTIGVHGPEQLIAIFVDEQVEEDKENG